LRELAELNNTNMLASARKLWNNIVKKFSHLSFLLPLNYFRDLHITENLQAAKKALKGQAGIMPLSILLQVNYILEVLRI